VLGICQMIAGLRFVGYVGALFGIYLLWLGIPRLMKASDDKALPYVATAAGCAIVALGVLTLLDRVFLT
jgi:H+/Cl- antiporter ClcA